MQFRTIGFLPILMTLTMGGLFILKFQRESMQTEYALKLGVLIDESEIENATGWKERRENYFHALALMGEAQEQQVDLEGLLQQVAEGMALPDAYRPVLVAGLQRNYEIASEFGLLSEENFERLEAGERLKIALGGHAGEFVVLDNLVPHRYSPELEMVFANLRLKPESVVRRYPNRMDEDALLVVNACRSAAMMSEISYARTMRAAGR